LHSSHPVAVSEWKRESPGTATGRGSQVSDEWIEGMSERKNGWMDVGWWIGEKEGKIRDWEEGREA
jgi:hypothetical protein